MSLEYELRFKKPIATGPRGPAQHLLYRLVFEKKSRRFLTAFWPDGRPVQPYDAPQAPERHQGRTEPGPVK